MTILTALTCLFISRLVYKVYTSYVIQNFGLKHSISSSVFEFKDKNSWAFTLFTWGFSIPLAIAGDNLWMFIAAILICITGAAWDTRRDEFTMKLHYATATGGIAVGMLSLWGVFGFLALTLAGGLYIGYLQYFKIRNRTWWTEDVAFEVIWWAILVYNVYAIGV